MPDVSNFTTSEINTRQIRTRLKLSEVERLIKELRIEIPCPSRQTLIRRCEEGIFDSPIRVSGQGLWEVYEDSFWRWAYGE